MTFEHQPRFIQVSAGTEKGHQGQTTEQGVQLEQITLK